LATQVFHTAAASIVSPDHAGIARRSRNVHKRIVGAHDIVAGCQAWSQFAFA